MNIFLSLLFGSLTAFFFLFIIALPAILWLWVLIDCLKSEFGGDKKLVWVIVIILLPLLGSILYLLIGRAQKARL